MTHSSIPTDTQPLESPRARYEEREESEARPMTRIAFGMLLANALLLVKDLLFGKTPKAAAHETDAADAPGSLAADAVGLADESWSSTQQPGLDDALADAPLAFAPLRLGTGLGAATDAAAADVSVNRLTFHGSSTLPRAPSNDNEPVQPLSFRAPAADGGGGGGGETAAPSNPYLPGDDDDDDDGPNRAPVVTARVSLSDMLVSQSIVIASFELLRSAFDPDGDALSVGNLWASSGSIAANASGGWVYTPAHGRAGEVVITYTVSDGTHLVPQYALLNVVEPDDTAADATATAAPAASSDGVAARTTSFELQPLPDLPPAAATGSENVIAGSDGDDVIVGTDGDDIILAGAGDDVIDARAGDDAIDAGTGDDTVIASSDDGDDRIDGGDGSDTLDMSAIDADITVDLAEGTAQSDTTGSDTLASIENVATGDGDDAVTGSDDANRIDTAAGDDAIVAAAGDDHIASGDGDDVVDGGAGCDTIDAGAGDDTIVVSASDTACDAVASGDGDGCGDGETSNASVASGDVAAACDDGDDRIDGGDGSDTLDMSAIDADITVDLAEGTAQSDATGSDTLASIENVATGDGDDAITGSDDANRIDTAAGDDVIASGAGDDVVDGGAGFDSIDAGAGDGTIVVGASDASILAATDDMRDAALVVSDAIDDAAASDGDDRATDDPAVTTAPAAACDAVASGDGETSNVSVASGDGAAACGDGDDLIDGGDGSDTLDMSAIDADITVDLAEGTAQSDATGSDTLVSIENVSTGDGDDAVTGSDDANRIDTAAGDDVIASGAGDDHIASGDGDDVVDGGAGCDTIDAGAGDDTIVTTAADTACDAVASGDGDGCADGETSNASVASGDGAAACGDGDDLIDGGDGSDTLDMSAIDADITVDLAEGTAQSDTTGSDTLASIENVATGDGDDAITGSDDANRIDTAAGDDAIVAAAGDDHIASGDGDDVVDGGAGCDTIDAGAGDDTIVTTAADAACDAVASGDGDGCGDGETSNASVASGDGAAACGDGDDLIDGGDGSDTLDMSAIDPDITVDLAEGTAQSDATGSDTLVSIENVSTGDGDDAITGSDDANRIAAGGGADVIAAGAGSDTIDAGAGDDVIDAGDGDDIVIAASGDGDDTIDGGDGSDTLDMSAIDADAVIDLSAGTAQSEETGSDTLAGIENVIAGSGDDTIVANDAVNDLFGGEGDDVFVFTSSLSAGNGDGSRDRILDFDVGDRIDIDDISREFASQFEDALVEEGIRRFVLLRDSAEFSEPGQLRIQYEDLDDGSSVTIIEGNIDDDADTEFQIELVGHHDMADDQFYHR